MAFDAGLFSSILPSLVQAGTGLWQSTLAGMSSPFRPVSKVPDSIKKATDIAQNLSSGNMPGYANLKGQVDLQSGEAINALKEGIGSGPSYSGAVADILAKQNQAMTEIGNQNATYKTNALQNYQNQLNRQGQFEDKNFNYNNIQKYQEQSAAKSALTQAGMNNIFNALNNISGVASYDSLYNSLFGGNKGIGGMGQSPLIKIGTSTTSQNQTNPSYSTTPLIFQQSQNQVDPNMPTDINNWFQYINKWQ